MGTDRRYTDQREEAGLGLYDYVARRYDPYINRWIQPDTIVPDPANPQSLNRYSYVYNNPLRYVDPTGHDPLDEQWQAEFEQAHGRAPGWYDRLIRLFSIAYPGEWDWSLFYNPDGSYMDGSIETVFRDSAPASRTWAGVPQALQSIAGWYNDDEGRMFARDIGTLFGGLKDRFSTPAWEAISDRNNPVRTWVYVGAEGLSTTLIGSSDGDNNIHHWAWGLAMGAEYAGWGCIINTGRELTQFSGDFVNTWSDVAAGNLGAMMGWNLRLYGPRDAAGLFKLYMTPWWRRTGAQ